MNKMPPIMGEDFIKEFNKNKPSQEFFDTCKKAGELIKIREASEHGKCVNYNICPSCSGWCNNRQSSGECVGFILSAYDSLKDSSAKLCEENAKLLHKLKLKDKEIEQLKINTSRDCRNCKYEEKLPTELPCRNCGYHNAEYFERKGEEFK